MKRKPPTLKDKLAATLLQIVRYDPEECTFVPVIPYEDAKSLTADQIIARFHFDHGIAHAHDGPAAPWNLTPMPVEDHRRKTADVDIPRIAKGKRVQRAAAEHQAAMQQKTACEPRMITKFKRKIPSRPFPKAHRPLRQFGGPA